MKKWILMVMAAAFTLSVSACSTVKGVGQDVSAVGDDIDTAATAEQKKHLRLPLVNHCNRGRYEKVFTACYFGCFFDRTCRMQYG